MNSTTPTFNRREILQLLSLGGIGTMLPNCSRRSSKRPNILFVMTDDHTHTQMGNAGDPILKTPALDRLANEGVRFKNFFCTNSLCAPSRATILSGCFSNVHGIMGNSEAAGVAEVMNPSLPTFPQLLQSNGYQTGLVGKWHLPHLPRGFDHYAALPHQGVYFDPDFIENGERKQRKGYVTDVITDLAVDFLDNINSNDPFCLVYQQKGPHRPFTPAPRHKDLFNDFDFPYPATFDDDYSTRIIAEKAKDMRLEISLADDYDDLPKDLSPEQKKQWIYQRFVKDHYRAMISIDEGLERILDILDQRDIADQTLVIYTSDNGFYLGEHGWYDKRFMYEPSIRVPLLIRYPEGFEPKKVDDHMIMNVDIAPTILDFAGVSIPKNMQGKSLKPLLTLEDTNWRESIYYSYYENTWATLRDFEREDLSDPSFEHFTAHLIGPHRGIRTDRYKLIEYYSESDYWEFFDLQEDPYELNNLYSNEIYLEKINELKLQLRRSQENYLDTDTWDQLPRPNYLSEEYVQ